MFTRAFAATKRICQFCRGFGCRECDRGIKSTMHLVVDEKEEVTDRTIQAQQFLKIVN